MPAPWACDYCGTKKGAANHWWMRLKMTHNSDDRFILEKWNEAAAELLNEEHESLYEHICSEGCASKALSQHMARVQAAPKVTTPETVADAVVEELRKGQPAWK
jgi:hypothetical protein